MSQINAKGPTVHSGKTALPTKMNTYAYIDLGKFDFLLHSGKITFKEKLNTYAYLSKLVQL